MAMRVATAALAAAVIMAMLLAARAVLAAQTATTVKLGQLTAKVVQAKEPHLVHLVRRELRANLVKLLATCMLVVELADKRKTPLLVAVLVVAATLWLMVFPIQAAARVLTEQIQEAIILLAVLASLLSAMQGVLNMNYALIVNHKVVNIVVMTERSASGFPNAVKLDGRPVGAGDDYIDGKFYRDGAEILSPLEDLQKQNEAQQAEIEYLKIELASANTTLNEAEKSYYEGVNSI
jgi:hypothetical protein